MKKSKEQEKVYLYEGTASIYEGEVQAIKKNWYYVDIVLKMKDGNKRFRIYDTTGELFVNTIEIGDRITGICHYDCLTIKNKKFNKINTFSKIEKCEHKKVKKEMPDKLTTILLNGIITNTVNSRDKKGPNDIAFCFKSKDFSAVDFILADKSFYNSKWFDKGSKVTVEVISDNRKINWPNRTYRLITMWSDET